MPRLARNVGGVDVPTGGSDVDLSPVTLARIRRGMRLVVTDPHGTAYGKFDGVDGLAGVLVYGKTGTAQPNSSWENDPTASGPWHLWFVGYAERPGTAQRVAFAMVLHGCTKGSGGDTAAPAVARFLGWWFGNRP